MSKLLIALARIFLFAAKALGIIPFRYNFKRRTATTSSFWRWYTTGVLIAISVLTPPIIGIIYESMRFLKQQPLLAFVGFNRFVVLHLCAIFTLLTHLLKDRSLIYCCNEIIRIFNSMRSLSCDGMTFDRSLLPQLLLKVVTLFPVVRSVVFYVMHDRAMENVKFLFALLSVLFCQLIMIMTLNMFYVATLMRTAFVRHLNRSLKRTFREIKAIQRQPGRANSLKMQKYCELADILDKMMLFHRKIVALGRIVHHLFQVQMLCFLFYVAVECVVQFYIMYFVVRETVKMGADPKPPTPIITYVVAWLVDFSLFVSAANRLTQHFAETKWIVTHSREIGRVDVRLERAIEQFSMYLRCETVAFRACGLFDIDNRCLLMMCQRLLISIVILMQFDTIIRRD